MSGAAGTYQVVTSQDADHVLAMLDRAVALAPIADRHRVLFDRAKELVGQIGKTFLVDRIHQIGVNHDLEDIDAVLAALFEPQGNGHDLREDSLSAAEREPDPPPHDHIPEAYTEADYGLSVPGLPAAVPTIAARPYEFCDPASIPRRQLLYGTHLIRGFTSATVAPPGLGKSSLLLGETLAMGSHRPLFGARMAARALRVWYWNLEDPKEEIDRRIAALCLHHGLNADDFGDRLHVNGREDGLVLAKMAPSGAAVFEPVIDALVAEIRARSIDVIAIDPFVSCHQVAENDNGAIDAVVKAWGRVAGAGNCAVELVHHARKLGDNEVTADASRGASSMVAACRDVRVLNRMGKDEAERAGVENHRLFFRVYSDKANLAPPSDKSDWYRLHSVDLGNGPPGDSDHVQAVARWEWPNAFDGVSAADLLAVQKYIAGGEWRASSQAEKWAGKAVAEVLDLDLTSATLQTKVKALLKVWIESGALKEVERADAARHPRKFIEVGQWAI